MPNRTLTVACVDDWYLALPSDQRQSLCDWLKCETGWDSSDVYSVTLGEGEVELELIDPPGPVFVVMRCAVKTLPPIWPSA